MPLSSTIEPAIGRFALEDVRSRLKLSLSFVLVLTIAVLLECNMQMIGGIALLSLTAPTLWAFMCLTRERIWPWLQFLFLATVWGVPTLLQLPHERLVYHLIEGLEATAMALLLRHLLPFERLARDSISLLFYIASVSAITMLGALIVANGTGDGRLLLVWWLRDLCGYVALAGPLLSVGGRYLAGKADPFGGKDRLWKLLGLASLLLLAMLLAYRLVVEADEIGRPEELMLASLLLSLPLAIVLADMFLGLGAVVSMAIIAPLAILAAGTGDPRQPDDLALLLFTFGYLALLSITMFLVSSRRRELGQALDRTRQALETQTRFVSRMNHELRTPLNAVLGFSELQRLRCRCPDAAGYSDNIHASGQRLLAMVEGAIAHGVAGSPGALDKHYLDVGARVAALVQHLDDPRLSVTCDIDCAHLDTLHIECDQAVLDKILLALVAPARRACGPSTTLRMSLQIFGTDLIIKAEQSGLIGWRRDQRDDAEWMEASRGALAHGARILHEGRGGKVTRSLIVFAVTPAT